MPTKAINNVGKLTIFKRLSMLSVKWSVDQCFAVNNNV